MAIWKRYVGHERQDGNAYYFVEDVINTYGHLMHKYTDLDFVYFHITTSANECRAIKKHGILDLKRAYLCEESELRRFLDQHGVFIDLDNKYLSYNNRKYDISFNVESRPTIQTEEDYCWLVGRKFYYDYTTCGFLSVCEQRPYSGEVHYRPEILGNIDRLLNFDLSGEWTKSHHPYEITVKVNGKNITYCGENDDESDKDKMLTYIEMAYNTAFYDPSQEIILLKNEIQISPEKIIAIRPLSYWI